LAEKLLTLFTAPKPFKDPHISIIQNNALKSWMALGDRVEIIILGNDEGVAENAKTLGIMHIPQVKCNTLGTPLISSMLRLTCEHSKSQILGIVNTDIILFSDLIESVMKISLQKEKFILIGQRWDMEVTKNLPEGADQFARFKEKVIKVGKLHLPMGSDYFIFPRSCYTEIPDLTIGRAGWDNWFIFKSRWEGWPVVDATHDVTVVHQNHDYRHLPGGQPHYRLPETRENVLRGGGEQTIFTIFDAQYSLINGGLKRKKTSMKKIFREIEIFPMTILKSTTLGKLFYFAFRPRKAYHAARNFFKGNQG